MTYKDLENFTYNDLSNFTYGDLELDANELLEKVKNDNRPIPISVYEKLQNLCQDMKSEKELDQDVVSDISNQITKKSTFSQAVENISLIVKLLSASADLFEKFKPIIKSIISFFE